MPGKQRTTSVKEKKLNDRIAKLAQDAQRNDGISIRDTDLQQWVAPPVSWSYHNLLATAVTRFKDFIKLVGPDDPRVQIKEAERYFSVGAQYLSLELIKLFILYLARTSAGKLDERITSKTARGYISHTLCAVYRSSGGKKQLDAADMSQIYAYINQLEREGELSNKTRVKPVATKNDLDILIAMVFSDTFALNLSGVRLILNLALYMNLYVDSCGRGSDLAWGGSTVVAKPNHCLCWDHCDFYVVCLDDGDHVIAANVKLEYQKGQTTSDEKKTITLRLLPTVMAMQDSLRLLVTLAIIDGVFGAGATWADLLTVDPGIHSCKIRQSDGFVGVPVFRSAAGVPLRSGKLGEKITRLGRMAGFEHNATPYALRRAYANVLYANVSAEDRRFLMGHKTNSDIYSHYHSAISTVSVQELFRDIRAGNAAEMHGLSLNRIQQIPQHISKEGWQRVQQDREIAKEVLETTQTTSTLQNLYGSVSAAVRACDPRIEGLVEATARLKNRRRVLMGTIYQEEYRMAFARHQPQQSPNPSLEPESISGHDTLEDASIQALEVAPGEEAVLSRDGRNIMDAVDSCGGREGKGEKSRPSHSLEPKPISIDNVAAEEASGWILEVAREEEAALALDDCDIIDTADSYSNDHDAAADNQESWMADNDFELSGQSSISLSHDLSKGSESVRSHKINDGSAIPKNMSITRFREAVNAGGYTDAALSSLMVEVFSAAHRSGRFIPGEEPLLGTYTCRFSGVDLSTNQHAPEAAHSAHAKVLNQVAKKAFEQHLLPLDLPCSYYAQGPLKLTNPKLCGFDSFKTRRNQIQHVFTHTLGLHKRYYAAGNIPRGEWHCYYDGCAILTTPTTITTRVILSTRSVFASEKDYVHHVYYEHRLSPLSFEPISWCGICERFIEWEQFGTGKDDHFATHWREVWSLVEDHGYSGQFDNGRRTIPSFCPFCLHNENLSPANRISATMNQVTRSSSADHVATHIDALDSFSKSLCPCFPTTCRYQQEMLPRELESHLSSIHGIMIPKITRKQQRESSKNARALTEISVNVLGEAGSAIASKKIKNNQGSSSSGYDSLKKCHQELDLRCLRRAHIIGVTTTGLARNLEVLRRVQAKVLVFEEAGEVLEAHTLTALLPSVEHAILIGDHEQLRPQINNYEFQHDNPRGARYSLDISLFERLIHPQPGYPRLPYSSLEVQRRMHPSIAELVRSTLYPKLQDHLSVSTYPEVDGMRKRLFWLDHNKKEDASASNTVQSFSKTNAWEVEMTAALVSHLVRQGTYGNEDIAVLTPYLGQLQKLKQRLRSSFAIVVGDRDLEDLEAEGLEGESEEEKTANQSIVHKTTLLNALRIATVDNFQGEEAKVIVISLVRSNDERKCGFLKTSNRINVLLSRARHGMYIIGNKHTARPVQMWDKVITILENDGNTGNTLALCCPRHKETPIEVSEPDDFSVLSPEGGCNEKCISRLKCGHACINKCHSEPLHNAVRCLERCLRTKKGCDHPCPKVCGDPCDTKCQVPMQNIALPCGHVEARLACHLAQAPEAVKCQISLETVMPGCKHTVKVRCCRFPLAADHPCNATCGAALDCGHNCKRTCRMCRTRGEDGQFSNIDHGICETQCGRQYTTCSHACSEACHGDKPCPLCLEPCEVRCSHSRCSKKCHEPCTPCVEDCSWSCPHRGACKLPCAVPCDLLPCSKRCSLSLSCGHQCPSVCGEICPGARYCQECADKSVKDTMVDYIMGSTYAEIDLDENPCIIPSCGHILTLESMDGHMELANYYNISEDTNGENSITGLKSSSVPFSTSELKNCPMCRSPLRNINRYGRIVRRAWIDEATKKFIVWANAQFVPLAFRMEQAEAKLQDSVPEKQPSKPPLPGQAELSSVLDKLSLEPTRLDGSREQQIKVVFKAFKGDPRYKEISLLRIDIKSFLKEVDEAEQPISRIHNLVQDARKHRGVDTEVADIPSVLQVRNRLLATVLLLRCDYAILSDFVTHGGGRMSSGSDLGDFRLSLAANRQDCETLIQESRSRQQPTQEVEGLLYWARFVALERGRSASLSDADMTTLVDRAHNQLHLARAICNAHPGQTAGMPAEVSAVETMLRDATFYAPVTNLEKAAVYAAMAQSFQGTGHWYYCVNGHPFTVGECGMPMQTARCPQCGATVGGAHHQPAAGVTRAMDLEAEFGGRGR